MSYFVAIDGLSGSGKSTAISRVSELLKAQGYQVGVYHDRLGEPNAARIDALQHELDLSPMARLYFMLAVRRQVIDGAYLPSFRRNDITIADRYYTSTIAYQAYGQGLDPDMVTALATQAAAGAEPERIFYLDVPVSVALERMAKRGTSIQVFDAEQAAFHERVRQGFLAQAKADRRMIVVDATQPAEAVAQAILAAMSRDLKKTTKRSAVHGLQ